MALVTEVGAPSVLGQGRDMGRGLPSAHETRRGLGQEEGPPDSLTLGFQWVSESTSFSIYLELAPFSLPLLPTPGLPYLWPGLLQTASKLLS